MRARGLMATHAIIQLQGLGMHTSRLAACSCEAIASVASCAALLDDYSAFGALFAWVKPSCPNLRISITKVKRTRLPHFLQW